MKNHYKGILYYIGCCLCFVLCSALTRYITNSNPFLIIFIRDIFCLIIATGWILNTDKNLFKTSQLSVQTVRSVFSFLGILCWLYSMKYIPITEATALNLTVPIFSTIIAILILGERFRISRFLGIILGMLGSYFIINPDFSNFNYYYLLPLGSALMFSIYNNLVRYLTFKNDPKTIMFYFFLIQTIICIPFIVKDFTMPDTTSLLIMLAIGFLALLNVYFHAMAFKYAEIGAVETFDFSRLIFAYFIGVFLFGEHININTIIGSFIIIITSLGILKTESYPQKMWKKVWVTSPSCKGRGIG